MHNHDQKARDMARSVLPSTRRRFARIDRRWVHKRERTAARLALREVRLAVDPDDVEADLDAILKDRIAASDDDDEDEPEDRTDPDSTERVAAKSAEEFTCTTCFMIVHPRQFGRLGRLVCPEGYDPCSSIPIVEKRLKKAAKK